MISGKWGGENQERSWRVLGFQLSTAHFPLPTIHCPLPTPHYPLPTPHSPLPTIHSPLYETPPAIGPPIAGGGVVQGEPRLTKRGSAQSAILSSGQERNLRHGDVLARTNTGLTWTLMV